MSLEKTPRPGGRSARVQQAVHAAAEELIAENGGDRSAVTIPQIAARAGVTPSTIYRRWGDLQQLLAAMATDRLLPESVPDTGSLAGDLGAWLESYVEDFSSPLGRRILRDMVADDAATTRYFQILQDHLDTIRGAALRRGEDPPSVDDIVDTVVAPIIYRILFTAAEDESLGLSRRLRQLLQRPEAGPPGADVHAGPEHHYQTTGTAPGPETRRLP
ncbi:MAG: TetR/AcrR family transcriptional regulator [Micrococcus sp.]|nr:TetR/AcrR family transcriptional regulator [Micrococcus sp.]